MKQKMLFPLVVLFAVACTSKNDGASSASQSPQAATNPGAESIKATATELPRLSSDHTKKKAIAAAAADDKSATAGTPLDPAQEEKAAKDVQKQLDDKAKSAENPDTDKRTPEEKALWLKLVDYIADHGKTDESQMGSYVSLSDATTEDTSKARTEYFMSVIGGPGEDGHFSFTRVESIFANWIENKDGQLEGDQWMMLLARNGQVAQYWHYHLLETKDGHVLKHESQTVTQDEANSKWDEMRNHWMQKLPADAAPAIPESAPADSGKK